MSRAIWDSMGPSRLLSAVIQRSGSSGHIGSSGVVVVLELVEVLDVSVDVVDGVDVLVEEVDERVVSVEET
jgi:hypothetical protein